MGESVSDFKKIYEDKDVKVFDRKIGLEDSTDEARTICLQIGEKEFYYELTFGKLIHTHEKNSCSKYE